MNTRKFLYQKKGVNMIKKELKQYLKEKKTSILNLGCGKTNGEDFFGIDICDNDGVDLVADCEKGIPVPDNTFDMVFARDFLEHIVPQKNIFIMEEIYRVLKPGGALEFMVPSTDGNNMAAFQDPTHYSFWNEMKFKYFYADNVNGSFRRLYDIKCHFTPQITETYFNQYNLTYVRGVLIKLELEED